MSTGQIELISAQDVKKLTSIHNNVSESKYCMWIIIAQDKKIRAAIGETCYALLLTEKAADTLTPVNEILLNGDGKNFRGIKWALAWWTLWYAYADLFGSVTPTGVQTKSDDTYSPVTIGMYQEKKNSAKSQGEYYLDQLICFIRDNSDDYPCYSGDNCCTDLESTGYGTSGIVTDDLNEEKPLIITS